MKYKVLIKQCLDPPRASAIAAKVAQWSGSTPDVVYNAVVQKAICIRKEADEDEALRLRAEFGAIGAEVELVPLGNAVPAMATAAAPVAAAAGYAPQQHIPRPAASAPVPPQAAPARPAAAHAAPPPKRVDDEDDEDEEPGRVLSDAEYKEMLSQRKDIFYIEKSSRLRNIEVACMILAIATGVFLTTRTVVEVATDFFEKLPEERTATLVKAEEVAATLEKKKEEEEKKKKRLQIGIAGCGESENVTKRVSFDVRGTLKNKEEQRLRLRLSTLEQDLVDKERQLQDAVSRQQELMERVNLLRNKETHVKEENERLLKAKEELEAQLQAERREVTQVQRFLDDVRQNEAWERHKHLSAGFVLAKRIMLEQQGLMHQLQLLQQMTSTLEGGQGEEEEEEEETADRNWKSRGCD